MSNETQISKPKFPWARFLAVSIFYVIITQVIHTVAAMLTMKYYLMEEYFPIWSRIMMPAEGAPSTSFYYYSLAFGFISALL
ncbi:MAG: hypothetical protein AB1465_00585 [Patescibacteria group bacterium]